MLRTGHPNNNKVQEHFKMSFRIAFAAANHRRRTALRKLALLSSGLAALAAFNPAFAAEAAAETSATADASDASDLGSEIVVTARHREEKAQDVPVAISVLGA